MDKGKYRADGGLEKHTPCKCFICVYVDHLISKCPKPPKDNYKRQNTVRFNERCNHTSQKECENGDNDNVLKICASMAQISVNENISSRNFGDSSQLTNWVLDSRTTCHMTPQVSNFISGLLYYTDKYIEVTDGHHVTAKQKLQVQIKMGDDEGDTFIATFHNILLAPDLCNMLFSIIALINLGHNCLFQKRCFYGVFQR